MAGGVSSSVRSIIDAFIDGFDVLAKLRAKQQRKKDRDARARDEDHTAQLSRSLRHGPQAIGNEYQRGMQGLGDAYARGDGIAQHGLAEILLRLNTGLVSIIASFLDSGHRRSGNVDYGALTQLSERSRRESLDVLRGLYQRTASRRIPARIRSRDDMRQKPRSSDRQVATKQKKIRGPTIARVTIEDSSRRAQLAVVKPGQKRKSPSSSSSNLSKVRSHSSSTTAIDSVLSSAKTSPRLPAAKAARHSSTSLVRADDFPTPRPPRPAALSSPDLRPDYTPMAVSQHVPPIPRPPRCKPTPTIYSTATNSTNLGEIPLHKWAVPYDFDEQSLKNRQAMQQGWPLVDLDGNAVMKPKKKFGLFGLFKKKEAGVDIARPARANAWL